MTDDARKADVRLICNRDSDEIMVHWPSGKVEFAGFVGTMRLLWWIIRNGKTARIVDAQTGEESDA